jgi:uncharacterized membrane protein
MNQEVKLAKTENLVGVIKDILYSTSTEISPPDFVIDIEGTTTDYKLYSNGYKYNVGDKIYVEHIKDTDGSEYYNVGEYLRGDVTIFTIILFIVVALSLYGWRGLKSLMSLFTTMGIIIFILLPLTLKGYNPVMIASLIAIPLLFSVMCITHGRNRVTYSAMLGCFISIVITVTLSYITIIKARITGFVDDTSSYLYFNSAGNIDFTLLVIASVIIGVIGVVDDGAITQARIVAELKDLNKTLTYKEYYMRAMNIGRDHAGAMINTLILAYTSTSLPLLLLFYTSSTDKAVIINKEIITTEILRSLIGSIGLLLTIPVTTYIAIRLIKAREGNNIHNDNLHNHNH